MFFKKTGIWRGAAIASSLLLALVIVLAMTVEQYGAQADMLFKTTRQKLVTEVTEDEDDIWKYKSEYKTAKEAYDGLKDFAIREAVESYVLLKNGNNALPLAKDAKITLLGMRSYAPVYGGSMGSPSDGKSTQGNEIFDAFASRGFQVNRTGVDTYAQYVKDVLHETGWATNNYTGAITPEYKSLTLFNNVIEPTVAELQSINSSFGGNYASYGDAAIVVVGRPGSENKSYYPGAAGLAAGVTTTTGNILSLTSDEKAIVQHAKDNFSKVIVLINTSNPMEIKELQEDADVDAVMWIGFPGSYGFLGVADVLNGTVSPSGHLGDVYAVNTAVAPAMANYGNIAWGNAAGTFGDSDNVNSYLIESEGIYTGYRYYETRYYDSVMKQGAASAAKAGTYTNANGTVATADGTWAYANEVVYPFGYGQSYTTFSQTIDEVKVMGNKKTATVKVTVKNTGNTYSGKSVVQLYAQTPYTTYDKSNGIEKAAIQLVNYEKTAMLAPNQSQTITMQVDMANLATYDYKNAQTFIVESGEYYFAIGTDVHNALNNILAYAGKTVADGMTENGDRSKVKAWNWSGDIDDKTFSVSAANANITNQLSAGDYATDINAFLPGTVDYLTRNDWNGSFPVTITGLVANSRMITLLKNDFYTLKTNEDTSDIIFGDTKSKLTVNDLKGAAFDDPRWEELLNKVTVEDFLAFAQNAFHNIEAMKSVGLFQYNADDGPGGSDSHYLEEGKYQGVAFTDAASYKGYGTRVAPAPINLAYTFSKELAYENGETILAESALMFNSPIMIGPAMNIHRHAYNARGFEYYSEDPILSGYTGSAAVQGAQSKGCLVNVKHLAFNDQETNRSGIAVFLNEQAAREIELRNFSQAFTAGGKPASFEGKDEYKDAYTSGALGVMTSYNRIGAVASSASESVMVKILRNEWGFKGYNVTDFTGVSPKAAPKESILFGTTAFCGMGKPSVSYWNANALKGDRAVLTAIKQNTHYILYSLVNSIAMNGINSTTRAVWIMTWWRALYIAFIVVFSVIILFCAAMYTVAHVKRKKEAKA